MGKTKHPGIESYETAKGTRYRARYRKPDGAQTDKRGLKSIRDARLFLASVEVKKATGEYLDPAAGRVTVADLHPVWRRKKNSLKTSYLRDLDMAWRVYVEPRWGDVQVKDVTTEDVEAWIEDLRENKATTARKSAPARDTLSASSVLRCLGILAGVLDDAVRAQRLHKNPARGTTNRPVKHSTKTRRYLTDEEVIALADATTETVRAVLVTFLAYTGLRWAEAVGLRVRDVNPLRRRVHVNQTAVEINKVIHIEPPKNWEKRTVPYPKFLAQAIEHLCAGKGPDDLVFGTATGDYQRQPHSAQSWFLTALRRAGIERITPHDLRHTAASLSIASGAHVKAVQRMLGHKSASMTLDTYADLFDSDLDDIADKLDERVSGRTDVGKVWAKRGIKKPAKPARPRDSAAKRGKKLVGRAGLEPSADPRDSAPPA